MPLGRMGYSFKNIMRVVCPDCGAGGGNRGPCWCHKCHELGIKVLMLPACNETIEKNWTEASHDKT